MTTERGTLILPGQYGLNSSTVLTFEETCDWTYAVKPNGRFT